MKRIWIILLAIAVALVIALPAGAKKPDRPDKPGTGFRPIACQIDEVLVEPQAFSAAAFGIYAVDPAYKGAPSPDDILCAEVRVISGTLGDLRVRWLDYRTNAEGGCYLARARGKVLGEINNGATFAVGLSLANWSENGGLCGAEYDDDGGNMTVVVMPVAKSTNTWVEVTIGIDHGG